MNAPTEKKILVVDDNEVFAQLCQRLVEQHGAGIAVAFSARDVSRILNDENGRFKLILLDLIMPQVTGWEILEKLRSNPQTKDTPIVIITGAALSPKEKAKLLAKVSAIIEKQKFTVEDFDKVLNQYL